MNEFGFESTADDVLAGCDLSGRTVLITGGYSGLGFETARALGAHGADIIIAGRDADKLDEAARRLADGGMVADTLVCNLADLAATRVAANEALARFRRIDILVNNAGVMACDEAASTDGYELQFAVNHLGHFLLTNLLVPLLREGASPRIVNLSSRGHHIAPVDFDDIDFKERGYDRWVAYGQSKTANILFAVGLEDRLEPLGIHAYAVHPGGIHTNLGRHLSDADMAALMARIRAAAEASGHQPEPLKTVEQGAATTCWTATSPELEGTGGLYCENCRVADRDDDSPMGGVRSYAIDPDNAERLWTESERRVGETFAFDPA